MNFKKPTESVSTVTSQAAKGTHDNLETAKDHVWHLQLCKHQSGTFSQNKESYSNSTMFKCELWNFKNDVQKPVKEDTRKENY